MQTRQKDTVLFWQNRKEGPDVKGDDFVIDCFMIDQYYKNLFDRKRKRVTKKREREGRGNGASLLCF